MNLNYSKRLLLNLRRTQNLHNFTLKLANRPFSEGNRDPKKKKGFDFISKKVNFKL